DRHALCQRPESGQRSDDGPVGALEPRATTYVGFTKVGLATNAVPARAAHGHRRHHPVPRSHPSHLSADPLNRPRPLVADHQRRLRKGALDDGQIGMADPARTDPYHHIAWSGRDRGPLLDRPAVPLDKQRSVHRTTVTGSWILALPFGSTPQNA